MLTKYNKFYLPSYRDDYFNDLVSSRYYGHGYASTPAVNIMEENDRFRIDVAAPGLKKNDFNIKVEDDILTISSEMKESNKEKKENYTRQEFNYASFSRSFKIGESINQDEIRAEHKDGVLSIYLPKKEEALKAGPKSIEIS